jgi:hypothetical protein
MSYKAFASRSCLYRWLGERGLDIDDSKLAPHGQHSSQRINGKFAEQFTMSVEDFENLPNVILETRQLDNGEYTLVRITRDETGMRTAHWLNCNVKTRVKFDYWESDEMCCGRVVVDGRESRGYRMADNTPSQVEA